MTRRICETPNCDRSARKHRTHCGSCTNYKMRRGAYPVLIPPPVSCGPALEPDYLFRDELLAALEGADQLERVHML